MLNSHRVFLTAVFTLFTGCSDHNTSSTKNVFGADDSQAMLIHAYPWTAIGRVKNDKGACTGTLVTKNLVLTAAHCIVDDQTGAFNKGPIYFEPNYMDGNSKSKHLVTQTWLGSKIPYQAREADWAILKLGSDAGNIYGWLPVHSTSTETFPDRLSVAGYSGDFKSGRTAGFHYNCSTKARRPNPGYIFHDCDTARGSSGGPALEWIDEKLTVIGVNVGEYRDGSPDSLHVATYSETYANIVIPSAEAYKVLKQFQN